MKKIVYKAFETKKQNNHDPQPSISLSTSCSELHTAHASTSNSTISLYTSNNVLNAECCWK